MAENSEHIAATLRRRENIIAELLSSEDAYRKQLQVMVDYFETPMRIRQIIPSHAIDCIFGNLHQIIRVNKELRAYLDEFEVGSAFLKMAAFLKLYSVYAKNHHLALSTFDEWEQKSARFTELRQRQECRPEVKMKFNALLITPVQRIPRYKLLLEDLVNHTLPTHEDYPQLKQASKEIAEVASHINNFIREHDNFNKMLEIQRSLSGRNAPKILGPGRKFIMEGPLKRVSRKGGRSFERMFFLFSDMLLYAKPRLVENGGHGYTCCCVLPLHHCTVERVYGEQSDGAMIRLTCKDELLLLYHKNTDQVETWITEMKKAIKEVCQSRRTLHKESSARRPMRKPDMARTRRQERLEKIRDENKHSRTPDKENASPVAKYVRNLTDIDTLCCTPRKKLNLDQSLTSESQSMNGTKSTTVADDSFCTAAQCEVDQFDTSLPRHFTNMNIEHEENPDIRVQEPDTVSVSSRKSMKRSMRRSMSNLSRYSNRLRSSFRTLRQKSSACSLRVKPTQANGTPKLDNLFPNVDVQLASSTESELGDDRDDVSRQELQEVVLESEVEDSKIEEQSETVPPRIGRNSLYGSEEVLVTNEVTANSTNATPKKTPLTSKRRTPIQKSGSQQSAKRKLKRRLEQVMDNVLSPVIESTASPNPALGGYSMVNGLHNLRHLSEPGPSDSTSCSIM